PSSRGVLLSARDESGGRFLVLASGGSDPTTSAGALDRARPAAIARPLVGSLACAVQSSHPVERDRGGAVTQIGFVGLGKMGANMVHRICRDSEHEVVAYDSNREAVKGA